MRILNNPTAAAAVVMAGLFWSLQCHADGAVPVLIANGMTEAVENMAAQARQHLTARQQLIDAEALVERRAAIVEHQSRCLKNGYSCIQPADFLHITTTKEGPARDRQEGPVDSSTFRASLPGMQTPGPGNGQQKTTATSSAAPEAIISWQGNTGDRVTLSVNGVIVTVSTGERLPDLPYKVRRITPTHITLARDGGPDRIVPVAWQTGNEGGVTGTAQPLGAVPAFSMPSSASSSSFGTTSLNLPPSLPTPPSVPALPTNGN